MNTAFHCVWIQGAGALPTPMRKCIDAWQSALPRAWNITVWDEQMAALRWPEYRRLERLCRHHANRADILRALILRDVGGLYADVDSHPVNLGGLFRFIRTNPTMLVLGSCPPRIENGLVWSAIPRHPYFVDLVKHLEAHEEVLGWQNCSESTGPAVWWTVLNAKLYDVSLVSERRAFTRSWTERRIHNAQAFVNHHYRASWVHEA